MSGNNSDDGIENHDQQDTEPITSIPTNEKFVTRSLAFACTAAALGSSFQHGYNLGVINSSQQIISQFINETNYERTGEYFSKEKLTMIWSWTVSIFCVGGILGGLTSGFIADRFGRKIGLLGNNVNVLIGVLLEGLSKTTRSYEMLIAGRFFIGLCSGINAGLAPLYLSEISPTSLRGSIGSVYQLVVTISILLSQVLGLKSILGNEAGWPYLLAFTILPAIFQVCTLPFCPESPKYTLINKQNEIEAQRGLVWLRETIEVHEEFEEIKCEYEAIKMFPKVNLKEILTSSAFRMPLIISCMMMVGQQFSGINAVIFYSTEIFRTAGLTDSASQYATMGMGLMNVLMTLVSLVIVERAGRKLLMIIGFSGMLIDSILLFICLLAKDAVSWVSYISIILVMLFVVFFATGPGSIPWFLVTELFHQGARPKATSIAVAVNWTATFIVSWSFLPLQNILGAYVFLIFAALLACFIAFTYFKVPETKNKPIEEITAMFRRQGY